MPNKKVIRNIQIDTYDLNISNWPEVCVENLTVEEQNVYYRRKDAIIMYMKNEKTLKRGIKTKRLKAGWDEAYRARLLFETT